MFGANTYNHQHWTNAAVLKCKAISKFIYLVRMPPRRRRWWAETHKLYSSNSHRWCELRCYLAIIYPVLDKNTQIAMIWGQLRLQEHEAHPGPCAGTLPAWSNPFRCHVAKASWSNELRRNKILRMMDEKMLIDFTSCLFWGKWCEDVPHVYCPARCESTWEWKSRFLASPWDPGCALAIVQIADVDWAQRLVRIYLSLSNNEPKYVKTLKLMWIEWSICVFVFITEWSRSKFRKSNMFGYQSLMRKFQLATRLRSNLCCSHIWWWATSSMSAS